LIFLCPIDSLGRVTALGAPGHVFLADPADLAQLSPEMLYITRKIVMKLDDRICVFIEPTRLPHDRMSPMLAAFAGIETHVVKLCVRETDPHPQRWQHSDLAFRAGIESLAVTASIATDDMHVWPMTTVANVGPPIEDYVI